MSDNGFGVMPDFLPTPPTTNQVVSQEQIVSLHTAKGVQLYQFLGSELIDMVWTREAEQVSRCEITVPSILEHNRMPDIYPWLHWLSVWDDTGTRLYWTGPIQKTKTTRDAMSISARDMAALFTRTRCPMTQRWDIAWPADVAKELLDLVIELHGLSTKVMKLPIRPLQYDERYDFSTKADETMFDQTINDLVRLGLRWTVVSGVPILGALPRDAVASLAETDFIGGGLAIERDGSQTFNDVLLYGGDALARAKLPMGNLNLQTVVTIDDMFGVSNVNRAATQHVRYTSQIRDVVTIPDTASLHPKAPVSIDQLIPSARLIIDAYGLLVTMELTGVDVSCSPDGSTVSIRMDAVNDDPTELMEVQSQSSVSTGAGET